MTTPPALRSPWFVRLWAGSIVSSIGTQMNNVAKAWVLYQLTHSAAALGLEGLCFSLPIAVLPLLAGPLVDRFDRARVVRIAMVVETVEAALLAAAAATGELSPWMIYVAAGVAAARLSFVIPASSALVPVLVPESALLSAQSLSAVVWSSSALVGPALGGLLLAGTGAATVFAVNGVATLAALVALTPVRPTATGSAQEPRSRLSDGLRFLRRQHQVLGLQVLVLVTSTLLIGTETLLPVLDVHLWHGGTVGYGLLRMAPGVAAILAGLALSTRHGIEAPVRVIGAGVCVASAGLAGFVEAPVLLLGVALLGLASVGLCTAQILVATRIQQETPDRLRGAVGGVTAMSQSGLAGVAAAGMAVAAAGAGAPAVVTVVAAVAAPFGLACLFLGTISRLHAGNLRAPWWAHGEHRQPAGHRGVRPGGPTPR